jgi:transcriptional regulator with XRE-family HTH domain
MQRITGIGIAVISRWETGVVGDQMEVRSLVRLCRAYNVDIGTAAEALHAASEEKRRILNGTK